MLAAIDANIWGLLVVPVGLSICFGPGLVVWLVAELRSKPPEEKEDLK